MKRRILAPIIGIVIVFSNMTISAYGAGRWEKNQIGWRFYHTEGDVACSNSEIINGQTYYFSENGYMLTGWQEVDGKWRYFDENGVMLTGTFTPDGNYVDLSGVWDGESHPSDEFLTNQVFEIANAERRHEGKRKLQMDQSLMNAAALRAKELKDSFSHDRPNGASYITVFDENGIDWNANGENLAYQYSDSAEGVMQGWMKSSHHRVNILNSNFQSIGIGTYFDGEVRYWVQLFSD